MEKVNVLRSQETVQKAVNSDPANPFPGFWSIPYCFVERGPEHDTWTDLKAIFARDLSEADIDPFGSIVVPVDLLVKLVDGLCEAKEYAVRERAFCDRIESLVAAAVSKLTPPDGE